MRLCQPRSDALRLRPGKKNGRDSAQGASAFGDIWNSCGLRRPVVLTNADAHRNGQCDAHADATCYRREAHLPAVGAAAQIGPPRGESQLGLAGVDCLIHSTAPMVFPRARPDVGQANRCDFQAFVVTTPVSCAIMVALGCV